MVHGRRVVLHRYNYYLLTAFADPRSIMRLTRWITNVVPRRGTQALLYYDVFGYFQVVVVVVVDVLLLSVLLVVLYSPDGVLVVVVVPLALLLLLPTVVTAAADTLIGLLLPFIEPLEESATSKGPKAANSRAVC